MGNQSRNGLHGNIRYFIFFPFNGLKFVFGGQKMIFWVIFGPIGMRWGHRKWPILGPVEIKDFRRCPTAHRKKSHIVTEA
jgi:hypothetical protein